MSIETKEHFMGSAIFSKHDKFGQLMPTGQITH